MKFLKTILRRVTISATREGQIKRVDATGMAGEEFKDRELFQHYGLTSRARNGAEGVLIGIGNVFYVFVEDDRRYRIAIEEGEVALYTDEGDKIHMKRNREIEISGGSKVVVTSPTVEIGTGTKRFLIDERIVTAINSTTFGGHAIDTPLVLANVATAQTKAS